MAMRQAQGREILDCKTEKKIISCIYGWNQPRVTDDGI